MAAELLASLDDPETALAVAGKMAVEVFLLNFFAERRRVPAGDVSLAVA